MLAGRDTSLRAATTRREEASSSSSELHPVASVWKSKSKGKCKRRFSQEQIRSLESLFEMEMRPELQTKQQLATELGLQPRQVAIWFQNKRARSKSKLIEQQYNILKNSYDALASKFDSLKKENQCLRLQLQILQDQMRKPQGKSNHGLGKSGDSIAEEYSVSYRDTNNDTEEKENLDLDCEWHQVQTLLYGDSSQNAENFSEDTDILKMAGQVADGCLISSANWCGFESDCLPDNQSYSLQW